MGAGYVARFTCAGRYSNGCSTTVCSKDAQVIARFPLKVALSRQSFAHCIRKITMTDKYRINPDFVVPEPTPARHFAFLSEEEYCAGKLDDIFESWRDAGVKQMRVTIVSDEYPLDPYPPGVWLEGWTVEGALQLPFGEPWPHPDSAVWPPLTTEQAR
jgi:hypothetical protein